MTTTTEDYVSFETAKLLKEKGFEGECSRFYMPSGHGRWKYEHYHDFDIRERIDCPTQQMVLKWLREIHDIDIMIWVENYNGVKQYVSDCWKHVTQIDYNFYRCGRFSSYNEACEAAIKYCLEHLI